MTYTTNSNTSETIGRAIPATEAQSPEATAAVSGRTDTGDPQRQAIRIRRKAGIHEPPVFRSSRQSRLTTIHEARIEGVPIAKQRERATTNDIEFFCGTSPSSVIAPASVALDQPLGQQSFRVTLDTDEQAMIAMRDDALTITLDTSQLAQRARARLEHNPEFAPIYDALVGTGTIYDDPATGHGSSDRLRTALAYHLAIEPIEAILEELADALAADRRRSGRQNILARVATHVAVSRPDHRTPIVRIKAGVAGRSGSVIAVLCAAHLRAVFAARGVNATVILESYGPTAFTQAYAATEGQPAFDHAAAMSLELEAIAAGAAEAFGISGQRLFDFHYLVDLPYQVTEGGELVAPSIADLERWLAQEGGMSSLLTTLYTEGQLLSDALTIRSARPDEGRGCVSTFGARVMAIDRDHLQAGALDVAARNALRELALGQGEANVDDDAADQAEAEGRSFAETLQSVDVASAVERSRWDEQDGEIEPVSYALSGTHEDDDHRSSQVDHIAAGIELLRGRERYAAAPMTSLRKSVERVFVQQRTRALQGLQARQAYGAPVTPWLRGVSAECRAHLDDFKAARDRAQEIWEEVDGDAGQIEAKLQRIWFWEDHRELLRVAERRFNDYSAAWFAWSQLQLLCVGLREEIAWLERFDEVRAVAAERARLSLDQLESRIAAQPNALIDSAGLGSGENDVDLAEAVAGGPVALDPSLIASLPDNDPAATIAASRDAVADIIQDRVAAVGTVQDALALKVRTRYPELAEEEIETLVWDEIGTQLIPVARAMTDSSNARFGVDAHTSHYLVTNQAEVPELEGNVVVERLDSARFAPGMPFIAFVRVQHGARVESLPWYARAVERLLRQRAERQPFVVRIANDYLERLT